MKPVDVGLAIIVAVIWGLAFVASRIALDEFSPELMTALRFAIAAVPCLLVRKPDVSWLLLIAISSTLFLGQFLAQAFAISDGVPVGISGVIARRHALVHMSLIGLLCMLGLGAVSTSIAYWLWGRLLRDYPAAQVVPFALLVPFVGSWASSIVFGERFGPLRLAGMITVVGGIAVMLLARRHGALPKIA